MIVIFEIPGSRTDCLFVVNMVYVPFLLALVLFTLTSNVCEDYSLICCNFIKKFTCLIFVLMCFFFAIASSHVKKKFRWTSNLFSKNFLYFTNMFSIKYSFSGSCTSSFTIFEVIQNTHGKKKMDFFRLKLRTLKSYSWNMLMTKKS